MAGKAPTAAQIAAAEKAATTAAAAAAKPNASPAVIAKAAAAEAKVAAYESGKTVQEATKAASSANQTVTKEFAELKSQQAAEVKILAAEAKADGIKGTSLTGLLNTVKSENKAEFSDFTGYMAGTLPKQNIGTLTGFFNPDVTVATTGPNAGKMVDASGNLATIKTHTTGSYADNTDYGAAVTGRMSAAVDLAKKYDFDVGVVGNENSHVGTNLAMFDKAAQNYATNQSYGDNNIGKALDKLSSFDQYKTEDGSLKLTDAQIGGTLKAVKGQDGLFQLAFNSGQKGNINKVSMYFQKNADGTYSPAGTQHYVFDDAPDPSGGSKLLGGLSTALNLASFAFPALKPFAMAASLASSIDNKNPFGFITSGIGLAGYSGLLGDSWTGLGTEIGTKLGLTGTAATAAGNAIIGAAQNKENPFAGFATGAAGTYLGAAWEAAKGDGDLFKMFTDNAASTGMLSEAEIKAVIDEATQTQFKQAMQESINTGALTAEQAVTAAQNSGYWSNAGDSFNYSGMFTEPTGTVTDATGGIKYDTSGQAITSANVPNGAQNIGGGFYTYDGKVYDGQSGESWTYGGETQYGSQGADPTGLGEYEQYVQKLIDKGVSPAQAAAVVTGLAGAGATIADMNNVVDTATSALGGGTSGGGTSGGGTSVGGGTTGGGTAVDWSNPSTWPWGTIAGAGAGLIGSYLNTQSSKEAAEAQAEAQIQAAKIAADAAKFRPVGVTTNFGSSAFTFDPTTGYLKSAGYTLTPEMIAQQDKLMAESEGYLTQYQGADTATKPMGDAAATMMGLGQGYLATTPEAQAKKYLDEQTALLAPGNAQEYANLQNKLQQQGRLGLSVGGESGLMGTNPELSAYQNKLEMQKRQLAAAATQGGMDYAKFGAGAVGLGGDLLKQMYGTQQAAYNPYATALGGAQYIEGLGQNAMDLGVNLGKTATAANAQAGSLLSQGYANAANTQGAAAQQAGDPWGNLLQGGANAWMKYQNQQNQNNQQIMYNPYTGQKLI
jgi:hypothetical protein